ncbi:MAG: hypothetical protein WBC70_07645 [Candidatus Aminicenantales bacterium]
MPDTFIGPRRPDPTGRYESPWGDIRDVASPFAGAAGFPWFLIPIAISILGSLFEEDPEEKRQQDLQNLLMNLRMAGIKPPYQSPFAKGLDPIMLQALLAQLKRTSNWGWLEGMGMHTSFIEDALKNLGKGSTCGTLPGTIRPKTSGRLL